MGGWGSRWEVERVGVAVDGRLSGWVGQSMGG